MVPLYCYLLFTAVVIARRRQLIRRELIFFLLYIFVPLGGGAVQIFLRGIAVVNVGVALLFILVNIQFEHEIALGQRENELAQMRIDIMLSQIQPHFLYNALATISHLCKRDPIEAQKAIQDFSAFLRTNMDSLKTREPVPFEQELNHVINYLYLEQRRFRAQLRVVYEIQVSEFFIPLLTLQPLVENVVRHCILKNWNRRQASLYGCGPPTIAVRFAVGDKIGTPEISNPLRKSTSGAIPTARAKSNKWVCRRRSYYGKREKSDAAQDAELTD